MKNEPPHGPGAGRPGVTLDQLLASDLGMLSKPATLFRFRIDDTSAVIDFGHLPPLLQDEIARLQQPPAPVHTRLSMPVTVARELATKLLEALDQAQAIRRK